MPIVFITWRLFNLFNSRAGMLVFQSYLKALCISKYVDKLNGWSQRCLHPIAFKGLQKVALFCIVFWKSPYLMERKSVAICKFIL